MTMTLGDDHGGISTSMFNLGGTWRAKAQWPNQAALNQNGPTIDLSIVVSEVLVLSLILHSDSQ